MFSPIPDWFRNAGAWLGQRIGQSPGLAGAALTGLRNPVAGSLLGGSAGLASLGGLGSLFARGASPYQDQGGGFSPSQQPQNFMYYPRYRPPLAPTVHDRGMAEGQALRSSLLGGYLNFPGAMQGAMGQINDVLQGNAERVFLDRQNRNQLEMMAQIERNQHQARMAEIEGRNQLVEALMGGLGGGITPPAPPEAPSPAASAQDQVSASPAPADSSAGRHCRRRPGKVVPPPRSRPASTRPVGPSGDRTTRPRPRPGWDRS
jgi:hypothetical protein